MSIDALDTHTHVEHAKITGPHEGLRNRPRLIIADDHTVLAHALEALLTAKYDVIATVADGCSLLTAVAERQPDIVVLDIGMPLLNGLEAARRVKRMRASIKLVFLTVYEDPAVAAEAFRAGASAYLLKRSAGSELLTAIEEVMNEQSYLTRLMTDSVAGPLTSSHEKVTEQSRLSARQREVLQLLAEGKSMKEVGDALNVATRTVAFHKYRMMERLGIRSTAQLVQYAMRNHVI